MNGLAQAQRAYDRMEPVERGISTDEMEKRATELLQIGGECYPLDTDNFLEAFDEASIADRKRVAAFATDNEPILACQALMLIANEYWIKQANERAEWQLLDEFFN